MEFTRRRTHAISFANFRLLFYTRSMACIRLINYQDSTDFSVPYGPYSRGTHRQHDNSSLNSSESVETGLLPNSHTRLGVDELPISAAQFGRNRSRSILVSSKTQLPHSTETCSGQCFRPINSTNVCFIVKYIHCELKYMYT